MKKIIYIFALVAFTFTSCEKNDENSQRFTDENINDGYLKFESSSAFLEYLKSLEPRNDSNINFAKVKSTESKVLIPDKFNSINQIIANIKTSETSQTNKIKSTNNDEIEEMTIDEYNVMVAKKLLQDPILYNVMDTTLRIGIGGYLYKITKDGTFFAPYSKEDELIETIQNFSEIKNNLIEINNTQILDLGKGVKFVFSFANSPVNNNQILIDQNSTNTKIISNSNSVAPYSEYVSKYGLLNNKWGYEWYNLPLNQWIFGKDEKIELPFDNDNRLISVELFNVNYVFYTSAGLKVKVSKKKKFLFTYYWVETPADKIVIGFEKFDAVMTYNAPPSNINPLRDKLYGIYAATFNGIAGNIIYRGYHNIDLVEDWVSEIMSFVPTIENSNSALPTEEQMQKFYDTPANLVYAELKKLTGKYIFNPIKKQIKTEDPKIAYFEWGSASIPIKTYVTGVQEYSNIESKTIRFNQSAGLYFYNGAIAGYLPTTIAIKDIDVFAASNDGGEWKGVRFYK